MRPRIHNKEKSSSLSHWINILNDYEKRKEKLSDNEVLQMYKECEDYRKMFNINTHSGKCHENEVNSELYSRARRIIKGKWSGSITSSHSIAR